MFLGTVTKIEESRVGGERATQLRFDVSRVYKGTVYADQVITTPRGLGRLRLDPRRRLELGDLRQRRHPG